MGRITDEQLDILRQKGFVLVRNFLNPEELKEAQDGLWESGIIKPEEYFAKGNEARRERMKKRGPFGGLQLFPFNSLALNKLLVHPDLIDACERFLGGKVRLTLGHVMSKYSGAANYKQPLHRDYGNHTLVVPRADREYDEVTTFLYLSDVTVANGATALVPRTASDESVPLAYTNTAVRLSNEEHTRLKNLEERAEGPAGSLLLYTYDVFHRGTNFDTPNASRFMSLAGYCRRDCTWIGKHINWGDTGLHPETMKLMPALTPKQRECMDFPEIHHRYWNLQTIQDVQTRYPTMDMSPYLNALKEKQSAAKL